MAVAAIESFHGALEALITAVSILGGFMAFYSGLEARRSIRARRLPEQTAQRINQGLAAGFEIGLPVALTLSATLAF